MRAPNETQEQYERKNELFKIKDKRELTLNELKELRELTQNAISHLVINRV